MNEYFINSKNGKINVIEGVDITTPKAIILYIHGFGGHFQYIDDTLDEIINKDKFFSKYQFKLFAFEFHGHGKSLGNRFYVNDFNDYVVDLFNVIKHINTKYRDTMIIICAKSMGCAVVFKYLVNNIQCDNIIGCIYLAPMCGIHPKKLPSQCTINLLLAASYIFPNFNTPLNHEKTDIQNNTIYCFDGIYKLASSRELYKTNIWVSNNINLIKNIEKPFLVFHGLKDEITSYRKTCRIFKNIKNKELILLDTKNHILLSSNDMIPNYIYEKILLWINELF